MEVPRSRKSGHPLGLNRESGLAFTSVTDEKKSKVPMLLASAFLFILLGSILYCNMFSFIFENHMAHPNPTASFHIDRTPSTIRKIPDNSFLSAAPHEVTGGKAIDADYTLGGLLAELTEFDPATCASRDHQPHRKINFPPSNALVQRLRQYEVRHRQCADRAQRFFQSNHERQEQGSELQGDDCRYVVWIANSGLGNRLMTLVSAFLYALLTNRTLLVDRSTDTSDLFCEPIPKTSWLVPPEITLEWLDKLNEESPRRFGHSVSDDNDHSSTSEFSYIHLTHTSDDKDQEFFCDSGQDNLTTVPWVFMRSNLYLVPGYYFVSNFSADLDQLFPDKEAIFHLLGRYLFHPSDAVWTWITQFYKAYLADRSRLVGIQVRTFNDSPLPYFSEQIQRCLRQYDLLPKIVENLDLGKKDQFADLQAPQKGISVLMTSLHSYYSENLREYYLSGPTEGDETVAIFQPSQEGWQQTDNLSHDLKAWAEIYLLSLSDELITSAWSTFGYSAQALAGIKPWILVRSTDGQVPDPPCVLAMSIEPCFHIVLSLNCIADGGNPAKKLPYVQSCEDVSWGIKLISKPSSS